MAYLDRLLTGFAEKGIRTPEAAEAEHLRFAEKQADPGPKGKSVPAQQYHQRSYAEREETPEQVLDRLNGGVRDA